MYVYVYEYVHMHIYKTMITVLFQLENIETVKTMLIQLSLGTSVFAATNENIK